MLLFTLLGSTLVFLPVPAFAYPEIPATIGCGQTITVRTTLIANIGPCTGNGLVIGANGITLNCNGHKIRGTGAASGADGILLYGYTGVRVENCVVTGFDIGIFLRSSSSIVLTHNTADSNGCGICLYLSSFNTLTRNTANSNTPGGGFEVYSSSTNTLKTNTADSNSEGFTLSSSNGNTLAGNTANGNEGGFFLDVSSSNTLNQNTANSNTIISGFYLFSSSSNTLTGNTANSNNQYGYYDLTTSAYSNSPQWDTTNYYTGDMGSANVLGLAGGNPNMATATSPF